VDSLASSLVAEGCDVLEDISVAHEIRYAGGASEVWAAMAEGGPWDALRLRRGPQFFASAKKQVGIVVSVS